MHAILKTSTLAIRCSSGKVRSNIVGGISTGLYIILLVQGVYIIIK